MANLRERILLRIRRNGVDKVPVLAKFTQSVVDYFEEDKTKNDIEVCAELVNNSLVVTDQGKNIKLRRPPFCPIHGMTSSDHAKLAGDVLNRVLNRGIDTGATIILESSDDKVLLTRRSKTLRTFPGIWVPPGGHLEKDETFIEAGLRELQEETGLNIKPSDCVGGNVQILALWESSFPPKLTMGLPKRHHIVTYLYGKLTSDLTADKLLGDIKLQQEEADACGWFDKETVQLIVDRKDDEPQSEAVPDSLPEKFKGLVINDAKQQQESYLPLKPLLNVCGDTTECERVSSGTKFALEMWLDLKNQQTKKH